MLKSVVLDKIVRPAVTTGFNAVRVLVNIKTDEQLVHNRSQQIISATLADHKLVGVNINFRFYGLQITNSEQWKNMNQTKFQESIFRNETRTSIKKNN